MVNSSHWCLPPDGQDLPRLIHHCGRKSAGVNPASSRLKAGTMTHVCRENPFAARADAVPGVQARYQQPSFPLEMRGSGAVRTLLRCGRGVRNRNEPADHQRPRRHREGRRPGDRQRASRRLHVVRHMGYAGAEGVRPLAASVTSPPAGQGTQMLPANRRFPLRDMSTTRLEAGR